MWRLYLPALHLFFTEGSALMISKRLAILSLCCALVTQAARANVFGMAPGLTSLQFVTVGNPGNAPDTRYHGIAVGSVDHIYQIGKYEITAGQYAEFLNAVAKADPNGLYDPAMGIPASPFLGANIVRSGTSPNFSYSVAADWANRPVNWATFWDAARFANWLHNGQPVGPQGPATTEGGAYHDIGDRELFGRNADARFCIPTDDEWYKAAYHDQSAGLAASYFEYPTSSNIPPTNTLPDPGNHANFDIYMLETDQHNYTVGAPYYRTEAGAFVNSPSPYGTFDQAGNVWEWNEQRSFTTERVIRGGAFDDSVTELGASAFLLSYAAEYGGLNLGFRVVSLVPEPSTAVLIGIGCLGVSFARRPLCYTVRWRAAAI